MRILFATTHAYLPQRVGGAEFSTHDLCLALQRQGTDVAVLAALAPHGILRWRHALGRRLSGRPATADGGQGYPVFRALQPEQALESALHRFSPDITVLHPDKAAGLYQALRAARQPVIVYLRDAEFGRLGFVPDRVPGVGYLANSQFTASTAREAFGIEATVVPPLIQPGRYATAVSGEEVLFVNPVAEKGVDLAFEIAALCPRRRFRFVEAWPLDARRWQELQDRARSLANVTLQRSSQDMRPVYARAYAVIVPSRWQEAWGRIVTEAQLNGIPVLASRIGGLPESVGDGGVLLATTAGAAAWAAEIERLFDDPDHRATMSRRAKARAAAPELTASVLVQRLLLTARGVLDDQ